MRAEEPAATPPALSPRDVAPTLGTILRGPNGLLTSLLLNGAAPFIAYQVLTSVGVGSVRALALTAVFPVLGLAVQAVRTRRADAIALLSLVVIVIGLAGTLISNDPRFYLVRVSFGTAAFGATCLVSLALPRPLLFYVGRQMSAGGDPARAAYYDSLWAVPAFRRVQRVLTATWGTGYLAEAAARVVIALTLPTSVVLLVEPVLGIAVLAALLAWTLRYGAARARAESRTAD